MAQRKTPGDSYEAAQEIIKSMDPGLIAGMLHEPAKLTSFKNFNEAFRHDQTLLQYTMLRIACALVNNYINEMNTLNTAKDVEWVKRTKRMMLRSNLDKALKHCGAIGECLNNENVIHGKEENVKSDEARHYEIDTSLIHQIFKLSKIAHIEKIGATDVIQLSAINQLIDAKQFALAKRVASAHSITPALQEDIQKALTLPRSSNASSSSSSTSTIGAPNPASTITAPTTTAANSKTSFNIFFLGTGETLEKEQAEQEKSEKLYKHTLLTTFQKITPDSTLITGIAAEHGHYEKTAEGNLEIKETRGAFGKLAKETIGGEGHEASMRAAFVDLEKFLKENKIDPDNSNIEINLIGFSRGAVSAMRFANRLRFRYPNLKVNLFAIDPVPGPLNLVDWEARNIPSNVREYHVVHMQHVGGLPLPQYTIGFDPQDFTRLTVERPDQLVFSADILPGVHGGAQVVRGPGMEDPARLTAYNLHEFLRRHGVNMPNQPIAPPKEDKKSYDTTFDYLTICAQPKERVKMFENMLKNEESYSKYGSKSVRIINSELHRYHQNWDYFLTQQHREDFKAVYPNIFYWFFEGGVKDTNENAKKLNGVLNEIKQLDKINDKRLLDYLMSHGVVITANTITLPKDPIGNSNYPVENSPYTNHLPLCQHEWIYYHPANNKLRPNHPLTESDLTHALHALPIRQLIKELKEDSLAYAGKPLPHNSKKQEAALMRRRLAATFHDQLEALTRDLAKQPKEDTVKKLLIILYVMIAIEQKIPARRGARHFAQLCWNMIEQYRLPTLLDAIVKDNLKMINDLINNLTLTIIPIGQKTTQPIETFDAQTDGMKMPASSSVSTTSVLTPPPRPITSTPSVLWKPASALDAEETGTKEPMITEKDDEKQKESAKTELQKKQ